jgi:hypothetical protein
MFGLTVMVAFVQRQRLVEVLSGYKAVLVHQF